MIDESLQLNSLSQKVGNQPLTTGEQNALVSRLEPYLKGGLSIRKACTASGVSRATLYRIMDEREDLRDQIAHFQLYMELLTVNIATRQLLKINNKQIKGEELEWTDLKFLMWFASTSRYCQEEFGRSARMEPAIDPEAELHRLMGYIDSYCQNA